MLPEVTLSNVPYWLLPEYISSFIYGWKIYPEKASSQKALARTLDEPSPLFCCYGKKMSNIYTLSRILSCLAKI